MRKTMTLLVSLLIAAPVLSYPREVQSGPRYIFGVNVNVREKPDANGRLISQLKIGTPIQVESRTGSSSTIDGTTDAWYRVKAGKTAGYVWGALIADNALAYDFDSDGRQELILIKNFTEGVYSRISTGSSRIEIRIAGDGRLMASLGLSTGVRATWGGTLEVGEIKINEIAWKKLRGFEEVGNLLHIKYHFSNEMAGVGEKIVSYNGVNLKEAFDIIYESGEGGYGCKSVVIYPDDKGGIKNKLIIETTCRDYTDEKQRVSERHKSIYAWDRESKLFLPSGTAR